MKKLLIRTLTVVIFIFVSSLIFCQAQSSSQTSNPALKPKYGGILKISIPNPVDWPFGDPLSIFGPAAERAGLCLERLLGPGDKTGTYEYILATGYKLAPDKSYYDINLRKGVKFHDGTNFNAKAVKWNLDRVMATPRPDFKKVKSIDVIDDHTIRLNLSSWDNRILNDLMRDVGFMISPTAYEKNGGSEWASLHPVGTGPFVFKEIKSNQYIVFERNNNYWEEGLPYLDGIELHSIPDPMISQAALEAGEMDILGTLDHMSAKRLASKPDYYTFNTEGVSCSVIYMNTVDPKCVWYDPRMRQALEYAIDKEAIIRKIGDPCYHDRYNIISGLEYITDLNIVPRKYDPEKARELMKAAGYPDGVSSKLYIESFFWRSTYDRNEFLAYQEQWAEVGIEVQIEVIEHAKLVELGMNSLPRNDMCMQILMGSKDSPIDVVLEQLSENNVFFNGVKRPEEWPPLLEKAMLTEDLEESIGLLVKMDKIAYDQAMLLPIHAGNAINVARKYVHDPRSTMRGYDMKHAWLSK